MKIVDGRIPKGTKLGKILTYFVVNKMKIINEDNSGAITISQFGNLTKNSKYIKVHFHFVNEYYENKEIDIIKVDLANNVADILTKALGKNKFENFRILLKMA